MSLESKLDPTSEEFCANAAYLTAYVAKVRAAEQKSCDLATLPIEELRAFSPLVGDDVYGVLSLEGSVASRNHPGGTAPTQVLAAVKNARRDLAV